MTIQKKIWESHAGMRTSARYLWNPTQFISVGKLLIMRRYSYLRHDFWYKNGCPGKISVVWNCDYFEKNLVLLDLFFFQGTFIFYLSRKCVATDFFQKNKRKIERTDVRQPSLGTGKLMSAENLSLKGYKFSCYDIAKIYGSYFWLLFLLVLFFWKVCVYFCLDSNFRQTVDIYI